MKRFYIILLLIFMFFISGCHKHEYTEDVTNPTCIENGYTTYTCECGDSYIDNETEALGHSYSEWKVVKEATEEDAGLKEKVCVNCNDKITEIIDKLVHTHNYNEIIVEGSCVKDGYKEYICECGDTYKVEIEALGHTEVVLPKVEATCTTTGLTEGKKCSVCNEITKEQVEIEKLDHTYTSVVTNPTCTEVGYTTYTCTCGDTYKEEIEALGHSYSEWTIIKEATETETGLKERVCSVCNIKETEEISKLEHTHIYTSVVTNPTCTEVGYTTYTCTCGDTYKEEVKALGHTEEIIPAVEATCTTTGLTEGKKCSVCETIIIAQSEIKALGHTEEIIPAVESTCTTTGLTEGKKCSVCNEITVKQAVIDELGHDYKLEVINPTCENYGYTMYTCSCGDSYIENFIDPLGHSYGEWEIIYDSTEYEVGLKQKQCSLCEVIISEEIPVKKLVDVNVTFDLNGGILDNNEVLNNKTILQTITISDFNEYDSNFGSRVALHENALAVYWKYIVLVETELNGLYKINEIVFQNNYITTQDFDYVVMWHSGLTDTDTASILNNILDNKDNYIGCYVTFNNLPTSNISNTSFTMDIIGKDLFTKSINKIYNEIESLPIPIKDGFIFDGWRSSIDNNIYNEYPGYYNNPGDIEYVAEWTSTEFTLTYVYGHNDFPTKQDLFESFFTDFYYFLKDNTTVDFATLSISSLDDFIAFCGNWNANGRDSFYGVGDAFGKYFVTIDVGGTLEEQPTTTFIGYCYHNELYVEFIPFLMQFFAYWRTDEGYTTDTNNGNDFFASAWASLVDTCKFFYFTSENLNDTYPWFNSERVKYALDNIPGVALTDLVVIGDINEPITLIDAHRNGYKFLGWYDENGKIVTVANKEMTVYAKWEEK